jgi:beta-glucosidase
MKNLIDKIFAEPVEHPYPENMQTARSCAADGMVLLKNANEALPLKDNQVALFGSGATETVTCGTGSGFAPAPYTVNVMEGLLNAKLELTSTSWLNRFMAASKKANDEDTTLTFVERVWSGKKIRIDDLEITKEELKEAAKADTAIYVISRNAGENGDRETVDGDYYLSAFERNNLKLLSSTFKKTIVVLNTCVIDANFINEIPGLDALVLMGLAGNESGNALADVLTGKVCPSGKLTDTWAKKYSDNPASATFGENDGDSMQEDYVEDIFVGYRYFDTFGVEPLFPFGYGLSYTTFGKDVHRVTATWEHVEVTIAVKNVGLVPGRDVTQVYVSSPEGRLPKPYQELKGFAKTKLLQPGETETLIIKISTESLASYDTNLAAFVMEKGDYLIRVGNDSKDTTVSAIIRLDYEATVRKVKNELSPDRKLQILRPPSRKTESINAPVVELKAAECITKDGANLIPRKTMTYVPEGTYYKKPTTDSYSEIPFPTKQVVVTVRNHPNATLLDVKQGNVTMEEFIASLDPEVLTRLVAGDARETTYTVSKRMMKKVKPVEAPRSSGSTTSLFVESLGIPNMPMTDGPAGLHVIGGATTSNPVGMVMAQTWDVDFCKEVGIGLGKELAHYNYSVILGPGMNIHRDPLCGRNFEYYSEDPLISGKMASAVTLGVQSIPGEYVAIKHFACNNQEANRSSTNSTVSERALREIYLRGFEICVREANPATVMTSYNKLNGIHTSSHYELLTEVLRGEWGFDGLVMTDWGSNSIKPFDLHAGNDLIMGGYRSQQLIAALMGQQPVFTPDGAVKEEVFEVYGGFKKEIIQSWNAFEPNAVGMDTVSTKVEAGIELGEKVTKLVADGVATVDEQADGSKVVTYRGTNKGSYLSLGDLQKCAANVLRCLMNSSSYEKILK